MLTFFIVILILLIALGSATWLAIAFCAWLFDRTSDKKIYDWEIDDDDFD
jgi:hypothetical protein